MRKDARPEARVRDRDYSRIPLDSLVNNSLERPAGQQLPARWPAASPPLFPILIFAFFRVFKRRFSLKMNILQIHGVINATHLRQSTVPEIRAARVKRHLGEPRVAANRRNGHRSTYHKKRNDVFRMPGLPRRRRKTSPRLHSEASRHSKIGDCPPPTPFFCTITEIRRA